jgi:hypothetical protein
MTGDVRKPGEPLPVCFSRPLYAGRGVAMSARVMLAALLLLPGLAACSISTPAPQPTPVIVTSPQPGGTVYVHPNN